MVVVMQERATDEQVQTVIAQLVEMGFDVHRSTGALRTVLGAVGGNRQFDPRLLEVLDGVQEVLRITEPYKLASRTFKPENTVVTVGDVRIGGDEVIVMAGPVLGGERGAGRGDGGGGQARRRQDPARRRVQAAQLALQLPGPRRGGPAHAARRRRSAQPEARLRGHGHQPDRADREVRGHPAGRRAQHAELHAAARARTHAHADHAQARHLRDDRGMAAVGRIHPRRRQHERDALRARHPHLRELHAQHARHLGHPGGPQAEPPADHRGPEPRHRAGATRWRRWRARRSPPAPTA